MPGQVGGFLHGHPGGSDQQRARWASPLDRQGMRRCPEHCLSDADHWHTELAVRVCAQARAAGGVEVDIAVDHQQAQSLHVVQHGT